MFEKGYWLFDFDPFFLRAVDHYVVEPANVFFFAHRFFINGRRCRATIEPLTNLPGSALGLLFESKVAPVIRVFKASNPIQVAVRCAAN